MATQSFHLFSSKPLGSSLPTLSTSHPSNPAFKIHSWPDYFSLFYHHVSPPHLLIFHLGYNSNLLADFTAFKLRFFSLFSLEQPKCSFDNEGQIVVLSSWNFPGLSICLRVQPAPLQWPAEPSDAPFPPWASLFDPPCYSQSTHANWTSVPSNMSSP